MPKVIKPVSGRAGICLTFISFHYATVLTQYQIWVLEHLNPVIETDREKHTDKHMSLKLLEDSILIEQHNSHPEIDLPSCNGLSHETVKSPWILSRMGLVGHLTEHHRRNHRKGISVSLNWTPFNVPAFIGLSL